LAYILRSLRLTQEGHGKESKRKRTPRGRSGFLKNLAMQEDGQGLTEYSLILGRVVFGVWVLLCVGGIGDGITTFFSQGASEIVAVEK
jgi:hypothetical protein